MKRTVFFVSFVLLPVLGFSQGEFLPKGQSGLGFSAGMAFADEARGIGGGVGYSFNGVFDIGLSYVGTSGYKKDMPFIGTFSPSITVNALKQEENTLVFVSFSLNYLSSSYSYEKDGRVRTYRLTSSSGYILGGRLFFLSEHQEKYNLMFFAGIFLNILKFKGEYGGTFEDRDTRVSFSFGLPIEIALQKSNKLILIPSYSIADKNNSINIEVGLIIPSKRSEK